MIVAIKNTCDDLNIAHWAGCPSLVLSAVYVDKADEIQVLIQTIDGGQKLLVSSTDLDGI